MNKESCICVTPSSLRVCANFGRHSLVIPLFYDFLLCCEMNQGNEVESASENCASLARCSQLLSGRSLWRANLLGPSPMPKSYRSGLRR